MANIFTFYTKRPMLLGAFLLVACSQSPEETPKVSQSASEQAATTESAAPLLSLNELLAAEDVKQGLAEAAAIDDEGGIMYWQNLLLEAADEVFLLTQERQLISGEQGRAFLKFQGMKTNYQDEFEDAFFNFKSVDQVYQDYPAFKDLHAQSRVLVNKRDKLIAGMAAEIAKQGFNGDAVKEAKRQWQQTMLGVSN